MVSELLGSHPLYDPIMANSSSSSSTPPFSIPSIAHLISIKLDRSNYLLWVSQFLPVLRSHDLLGIVDGIETCPTKLVKNSKGEDIINPEFTIWNKKDQYLLSWLNATLSNSVLSTVYGLNTSRQVWNSLTTRFAS